MKQKENLLKIEISPGETIVAHSQGESMLESLLKSKIQISHSCGGMGTCGTCRVIIIEGQEFLEAPNEIEGEMIRDRNFAANERLACQNRSSGPLKIQIPS